MYEITIHVHCTVIVRLTFPSSYINTYILFWKLGDTFCIFDSRNVYTHQIAVYSSQGLQVKMFGKLFRPKFKGVKYSESG